jgi:septum formation protein
MNKTIVLASASPRRKELLTNLKLDFTVHPSSFEEKAGGLSPEELAQHNALGKAHQVSKEYRDALVIGVDTVVAVADQILGKPKDREDHERMISLLSGKSHKVISSICIINTATDKNMLAYETTLVHMGRISEEEVQAYVDSGEGDDKASGYAIQGLGSLFIKKIEGDYFNVVGLPIYRLRKMFKEFGIKKVI